MWIDPIVEEIRREREAYAAKFNFDIDAICQDMIRQQQESGRELVTPPLKRHATETQETMRDEYDFSSAKRGPVVPLPSHQTEVRLRLDNKVIDWLRKCANEANGGSYQDITNAVLRIHMNTPETVSLTETKIDNKNGTADRKEAIAL